MYLCVRVSVYVHTRCAASELPRSFVRYSSEREKNKQTNNWSKVRKPLMCGCLKTLTPFNWFKNDNFFSLSLSFSNHFCIILVEPKWICFKKKENYEIDLQNSIQRNIRMSQNFVVTRQLFSWFEISKCARINLLLFLSKGIEIFIKSIIGDLFPKSVSLLSPHRQYPLSYWQLFKFKISLNITWL